MLIEALACQRPILFYPSGAIKEITNFLDIDFYQINTFSELVPKIKLFLDNSFLNYSCMKGERIRDKVIQYFSIDITVNKILNIYKSISYDRN